MYYLFQFYLIKIYLIKLIFERNIRNSINYLYSYICLFRFLFILNRFDFIISFQIILHELHFSADYGLILTWIINLSKTDYMCDAIFVYKEENIDEILIDNSPVSDEIKHFFVDWFGVNDDLLSIPL